MARASLRHWIRRLSAPAKPHRRPRTRLVLEVLEGRTAPAVFTVNTFADTVEATRDGSGLDAAGQVSLRSAAMATNDLGGSNTIVLSAGTYNLTIPPVPGGGDEGGHINIGRGLTTN